MRHLMPLLVLAGCSPLKVVFDDTQTTDTAIGVDDTAVLYPELEITPSSIDFGTLDVDEQATVVLSISNVGEWPMLVESGISAGELWFGQDGAGFTVAPGAASSIRVTFVAAEVGIYSGTLLITSDDPDEASVDVPLLAAVLVDQDGDGFPPEDDCDDSDATINPEAAELWYDGIDQDCSGGSDYDQDGDGSLYGEDCDDTEPGAWPGNDEVWYDGVDGDCSSGSDYDQDGDSWDLDEDCDDTEATANPGTLEIPDDGIDNDCDGEVDEQLSTSDPDGDGYSEATGDCDEADSTINPDASEIWYDGVDQNCDGNDTDQDEDGYAVEYDCDDEDAAVNPAAAEIWYDGADQDCDGLSDYDQDFDGYDTVESGGLDCDDSAFAINPAGTDVPYDGVDTDCSGGGDYDADGDGYDSVDHGGLDCDDADATVNPAVTEVWYDGTDANCDGASDYDQDGDGQDAEAWGGTDCNDVDATVYVGGSDVWYDGIDADCDGASDYDQDGDGQDAEAWGGTDCNDVDATVNPAATEVWYDGTDANCDGTSDYDQDGDGQDAEAWGGTDCNDVDATVYVGASDAWYDGVDQDCDGASDFDADADGYDDDGFGGADCDDASAAINPGATELCDGVDNDCDGAVDDGVTRTWYRDADSDGYGDVSSTTEACSAPVGYVASSTDCNDSSAAVSPADTETCNSVDDDCDGTTDEGVTTTYYLDSDTDGYGLATSTTQSCSLPAGYSTVSTDCDDSSAAVSPADTETCNSVDDDCDGTTDEGVTTTYYLDSDTDGYGVTTTTTAACSLPSGYSTVSTDCNDGNASISPGDVEVCNSLDDDCDGSTDEGVTTTYYLDSDSDGYGVTTTTTAGCSLPSGYSTVSTDCNDGNASISPGDVEVCNSLDDDCDGSEDEGIATTTWYADTDADGYGDVSVTASACAVPTGYVATGTDCDDADATSNPGAAELGYDVADNDCDGYQDEMLAETESDWTVRGVRSSDAIGTYGVYTNEDLDGDGNAELVIAAGLANTSSDTDAGYLAFHDTSTAGLNVALTSGYYYYYGSSDDDFTGHVFAGVGDVDGDGYSEIAVGSYQNDQDNSDEGQVYLFDIQGETGNDTASSSGADGVVRGSANGGQFGYSVASGDFDGDGMSDLASGAPIQQSAKGRVYVTFEADGLGTSDIDDDDSNFYITGVTNTDHLGYSVAFGDFNNDNYDDLVACGPDDDDNGSASGTCWVVDGSATRDTATTVRGSTVSSVESATIVGSAVNDQLGYMPQSISVGDLDDDAVDDLAIGVPGDDDYTSGGGAVWVWVGGTLSGSESYSTATYVVTGDGTFGTSVNITGDATGDGIVDLLGGAITAASTYGRVYLLEGGLAAGTYAMPTDQYASWQGYASGDYFGTAVSGVQDLDGDGRMDFAVSAPGNNGAATDAGKVYVLPAYP